MPAKNPSSAWTIGGIAIALAAIFIGQSVQIQPVYLALAAIFVPLLLLLSYGAFLVWPLPILLGAIAILWVWLH